MSDEKEVSGEVIESQTETEPQNQQQSQTEQQANNNTHADVLDSDTRTWGMFCHLSAFLGFIIPFFNIVGPLIVWLIKKDEMDYVDHHGKEALNFQITIFLAFIACLVLSFIVIGVFLIPIVGIFSFVMTIIAGIKANGGEHYKYPICLRLIK